MKATVILLTCVLAGLSFETSLAAQGPALNEGQGHPLKGSWLGDWGPNKATRNPVLIEIDWDGKVITGTINPGPDAIRLSKADLNPDTWTVHFAAAGAGGVRYVIDGKIENLGALNRSSSGTWMQGNSKGDFKITRQ
jgi:hypothetical protein